jgi:putative sterol carrier protein
MAPEFPSLEWLQVLQEKLNNDDHYAGVAKNWEGDMLIIVDPQGKVTEQQNFYFDLWHGKCNRVEMNIDLTSCKPAFTLRAPFENYTAILTGKIDPMAALMTNKLHVKGSMAYMMRNVPTVLDFVRCAKEVTGENI